MRRFTRIQGILKATHLVGWMAKKAGARPIFYFIILFFKLVTALLLATYCKARSVTGKPNICLSEKLQGVKRCEITMLHHIIHWHFSGKGGARGKFGLVCKLKSPKVIKVRASDLFTLGAAELQT